MRTLQKSKEVYLVGRFKVPKEEIEEIAHGKSYGVHALTIQKRINRAERKDFHTYLGLSLAANNLPLFSRQSKTKLAAEASANVEKKK